ncbi:Putative ABC transport system permease protein [Thioalkalivibrio nitratireducens DSM 14787]|uniref:ABC transport system permease protein n=1 Tax=Thioalkalivibrio nitratireducens (strain DSM 14787 / UNIQEM 213 / ALEN2) TaxID=1255043 RepID=L0DVA9_THIND|nr:MlaE family lipid ABC transporter permease subunit [Thioalkalivibrio nitratireducens]AGA32905.1 Putative ABC transport system permease protein [Thioalkalivibrio nitratireducens DSM 14787]
MPRPEPDPNPNLRYRVEPGPPARIAFAGRMDAYSVGPLWESVLRETAGLAARGGLLVDLSEVRYCDGAGAALLFSVENLGAEHGVDVRMEGLDGAIEGHLRPYREAAATRSARSVVERPWTQRLRGYVAAVGHEIHEQVAFIGEYSRALTLAALKPNRVRWGDTLKVAEAAGFQALPIVSLIAFLLGVILAFQSAIAMSQFGAQIFVADLVAISLLRELGPLMMAILLAGRSGAAFAAEIGTMKVNEEINALRTMGLDPVRFLVVPRILAGVFVAPLLTLYANLIGLIGAALVMRGFGIPWVAFFNQVSGAVTLTDLASGLFKAAVFGLLVASVGCLRGLQTGNGAAAVGRSTTSAVVSAIILIVVADGLFAVLFYHFGI